MMSSSSDAFYCPSSGHCDLNLPLDPSCSSSFDSLVARLRRLHALKYTVAAFNVSIHQEGHKSKMAMRSPMELKEQLYSRLNLKKDELLLLSRLTVFFEDNNVLPLLNTNVEVQQFDLMCMAPTSVQALQLMVKSGFRFDLVQFQQRFLPRKLFNECVSRHVHFDVSYAPLIVDDVNRASIIAQSTALVLNNKKAKQAVVVSSNAQSVLELRSPYDVANLTSVLFKLGDQGAHMATGKNALQVVRAAAGRRLGPYRARVRKLTQLQDSEKWKVPRLMENNNSKDKMAHEETKEIEGKDMQVGHCGIVGGRLKTPIGVYSFEMCEAEGLHSMNLEASIIESSEVELLQCSRSASSRLDSLVKWMRDYFKGHLDIENNELPGVCRDEEQRSSSSFRCHVYKVLRERVGLGQTVSYATLAAMSGRAKAARAIGSTMSNNPVPLITPCHRIIRADGHMGHYSKSKQNEIKEWLIKHEKKHWGSDLKL